MPATKPSKIPRPVKTALSQRYERKASPLKPPAQGVYSGTSTFPSPSSSTDSVPLLPANQDSGLEGPNSEETLKDSNECLGTQSISIAPILGSLPFEDLSYKQQRPGHALRGRTLTRSASARGNTLQDVNYDWQSKTDQAGRESVPCNLDACEDTGQEAQRHRRTSSLSAVFARSRSRRNSQRNSGLTVRSVRFAEDGVQAKPFNLAGVLYPPPPNIEPGPPILRQKSHLTLGAAWNRDSVATFDSMMPSRLASQLRHHQRVSSRTTAKGPTGVPGRGTQEQTTTATDTTSDDSERTDPSITQRDFSSKRVSGEPKSPMRSSAPQDILARREPSVYHEEHAAAGLPGGEKRRVLTVAFRTGTGRVVESSLAVERAAPQDRTTPYVSLADFQSRLPLEMIPSVMATSAVAQEQRQRRDEWFRQRALLKMEEAARLVATADKREGRRTVPRCEETRQLTKSRINREEYCRTRNKAGSATT
jgi:hypothetical protein